MNVQTYNWHGIDASGMRVQGTMAAVSVTAVRQILAQQNIALLKVGRKRHKAISAQHITDFSRQMSTMINAGIPLLSALNIIEHSYAHGGMRTLVWAIKQDIEAGLTLSKAFKKRAHYFDHLMCNLIYVGEQSGTLAEMLGHIAAYKEKIAALKNRVKKALFYPLVVLCMAVIVTSILLMFVVPQFAKLFQGFGAALPVYTRLIISLSNIIKNYGFYIIASLAIGIVIFRLLLKNSSRFAFAIDKFMLKLPIFGRVLQHAIIARFTRTLAITFIAGLPISDALKIISGTAGNRIYQQEILTMRECVIAGQTIAAAMEKNALFPSRVVQMIHIGEESGALDVMLVKIAEYYEAEVNHIVDNLSNLLEPVIMTILGVLVGGLIIGMYLPIFKLGTVI